VLATAPAAALAAAISRCLDPSVVFLLPLASRLLRLLLQCVSRFIVWFDSMLPAGADAPAASDPAAAGASAGAAAAGAAAATGTGARLSDGIAGRALYFDMLVLIVWMSTELAPRLASLLQLPATESGLSAECAAALEEAITSLATRAARLRACLVDGLSAECAKLLAPVRAVVSSYRMTGRAAPTQASFFVADVLRPLRGFLDSTSQRLSAEASAEWVGEVAARVTRKYVELAASTLDVVRRDQQARQRLAIGGTSAAAPDGSGVSDAHKIGIQMVLDVQAYAGELERVGVSASGLGEYAELQEAVRPEDALVDGSQLPLPVQSIGAVSENPPAQQAASGGA
jgi:hypothetical protein